MVRKKNRPKNPTKMQNGRTDGRKKTPEKPVVTRAQKVRKIVRKQVRKFLIFCQKRNASKACQNRTSENDGEASSGAGLKGGAQVRKQVRKMKVAYLKIVPKNVPHKMPENPAMARVRMVRKGTKKSTQIAQIQVRKVRKTKRIKMRSFFSGKGRRQP